MCTGMWLHQLTLKRQDNYTYPHNQGVVYDQKKRMNKVLLIIVAFLIPILLWLLVPSITLDEGKSKKPVANEASKNIVNTSTQSVAIEKEAVRESLPITENASFDNSPQNEPSITTCSDRTRLIAAYDYSNEALQSHFKTLQTSIGESEDIDSRISFPLMTISNRDSVLDTLMDLQEIAPNHKVLSQHILAACLGTHDRCASDVFENAIDLDSQNGSIWLLYAQYESIRGNKEKATSLLKRASQTSFFDEYYWGYLDNFRAAFASAGAQVSPQIAYSIVANALDTSTMLSAPYNELIDICKKHSDGRNGTQDVCVVLGKHMEENGSSLISRHIGLAIQRIVHEQRSNQTELELIDKRTQKLRSFSKKASQATELILQSRKLSYEWYEQLSTRGEVAGLEYNLNQAIELSKNPNFDPCSLDW